MDDMYDFDEYEDEPLTVEEAELMAATAIQVG